MIRFRCDDCSEFATQCSASPSEIEVHTTFYNYHRDNATLPSLHNVFVFQFRLFSLSLSVLSMPQLAMREIDKWLRKSQSISSKTINRLPSKIIIERCAVTNTVTFHAIAQSGFIGISCSLPCALHSAVRIRCRQKAPDTLTDLRFDL